MKLINWLLILVLLGSFASCGSSSEDGAETEGDEITEAQDSEFEVEEEEFLEDDIIAEEGNEVFEDDALVSEDAPSNVQINQAAPMMSDNSGSYTVQAGDTMMLISFKIYGDYSRWRSIANMNPGVNSNSLSAGTVLQYNAPVQAFSWNPRGNPHLIRRGETLGTISKDKYGTTSKWRDLHENNKPMIQDPNLIFAGFTLYWLPERDLASE